MTIELGLGIESLGLFNDLFDERLESGRFDVYFIVINVTIVEREAGVSGFLCLGRLFQGQPNEAALCI